MRKANINEDVVCAVLSSDLYQSDCEPGQFLRSIRLQLSEDITVEEVIAGLRAEARWWTDQASALERLGKPVLVK